MAREVVVRQQCLMTTYSAKQKTQLAEFAGGTTAECAAICCCIPCGLVSILVLTMYKLPAGICRKTLLKMKKKEKKCLPTNELLTERNNKATCEHLRTEQRPHSLHPVSVDFWPLDINSEKNQDDPTAKRVLELENEMWARFYSTGFWRSPSQTQRD